MARKRTTTDEGDCYLFEKAAQYVAKGLEMGAYEETVGGNSMANRLLTKLKAAAKRRCARGR